MATLNGQRIPDQYQGKEVLEGVSRESRFLRWLAHSAIPDLFDEGVTEGRSWPAAFVLSYFFTKPETMSLKRYHR